MLRLFEAALEVLWTRTSTTLGEVTLTAIAERVVHRASQKFEIFSALRVEPTGGIQCGILHEQINAVPGTKLIEGVRFVLVEFLTVLGNLTAEILTPELHAALSKVAVPKSGRATRAPQPSPIEPADNDGEDDRP